MKQISFNSYYENRFKYSKKADYIQYNITRNYEKGWSTPSHKDDIKERLYARLIWRKIMNNKIYANIKEQYDFRSSYYILI